MAEYCLYHYRYFYVLIILDSLNLPTFYDCLNRLSPFCHLYLLWFLYYCLAGPLTFLLLMWSSKYSCSASYWSCTILLYKLFVGFTPLLARHELVTLFSCVLRFYTSCLLVFFYYWLDLDLFCCCLVCYAFTQVVYWLCSAIGSHFYVLFIYLFLMIFSLSMLSWISNNSI